MPTRPPVFRPARPAAPALGYNQTTRKADPTLAAAQKVYSGRRWQAVRRLVLGKQPLCANPYDTHREMGHAVLGTQVDHIVPLRTRPDLAYTLSNLQALCTACHARKSQEERRGSA